MSQPVGSGDLVTPEAVALSPDVAGLGSRMIAALIDIAIQAVVAVGLWLLFFLPVGLSGDLDGPGLVLFIVLVFLVTWGYYPLFEGLWNGRTPGKRLQRIRVIRSDGQPVTIGPVVVRNLVRLIDWLPTSYGVGAVTMILTSRPRRLGDLAAGTIVVRERPLPPPVPLDIGPEVAADAALDTTALTEREYALVRSLLERRKSLDPVARQELAGQMARGLKPRVGAEAMSFDDDEAFLAAVLRSYRRRFSDLPGRQSPAPPPIPPPP